MPSDCIQSILVLGCGSAGFLAAVTLKRWLPQVAVTVLRSKDIGIIGVGEGTTVGFTTHLHGNLGLDPGAFYRDVEPVWKLGGRFPWGKRPFFDYGFSQHLNFQHPQLPKAAGFYAHNDMTDYGPHSAMMSRNRAFLRDAAGKPIVDGAFAYHLENETFVRWLEKTAVCMGVGVTEGSHDRSTLASAISCSTWSSFTNSSDTNRLRPSEFTICRYCFHRSAPSVSGSRCWWVGHQ